MAIGGQIGEITAAAKEQGLIKRGLQMPVARFNGAVLVRHARVVTGRHHAVMGAECLVTLRLIFQGIAFQVAESGGQTVAAMLARCAAEGPEGILQSFSQGNETLAA